MRPIFFQAKGEGKILGRIYPHTNVWNNVLFYIKCMFRKQFEKLGLLINTNIGVGVNSH
jgi:hypothetical protein